MPRQIIDTESSRPRYVRRVVLTVVFLVLAAAVIIVLAFAALGRFQHAGVSPSAAITPVPAVSGRPPGK